ncbi:hypothetical protein DPSP01_013091 [Paraphaeosphaeria sporulosa]
MDNQGAPARSSFPNSSLHATSTFKNIFQIQRTKSNEPQRWKSPALHPATLIIAIITPLLLILTLVLLLRRSQREHGIIFSQDINALPLSRTFLYQYFPTILAVVFSIFWAWIDLEVKRLEPWHRLSNQEGALGKDSLLLAYPFGFVPLVPVRALKNRHWNVFWASLALVLVTWGLVPTQSGIFSTEHVTRTFSAKFDVSASLVPASEQPQYLATRFAQSTYGIVVLNESLPEYMTLNYTLAPFKPSSIEQDGPGDATFWTAPTVLYGLDLRCEVATKIGVSRYNNSKGCAFGSPLDGNTTMHAVPQILSNVKKFQGQYAGYFNPGMADFYLSSDCPQDQNHTFFAAFTQNKKSASDPPNNITAIFCTPEYYSQEVNATVESATKRPTKVETIGPKRQVDNSIFNSTWMEQLLNGGWTGAYLHGDGLPDNTIPNYMEKITDMNVSWESSPQPMLNLAIIVGQQTELESYLDWRVLASSYEKAYRLLFLRAMVDVLEGREYSSHKTTLGELVSNTSAVVLEPVFAYIVVGFLGILTVLAAILYYQSISTQTVLCQDPGTIASLMGLVANNYSLLADFEGLDCCTNEEIEEIVAERTYKLVERGHKTSIVELASTSASAKSPLIRSLTYKHSRSLKSVQKPVRPKEFSWWMLILLIGFFLGLAIGLALLFIKARLNGVALPSQNNFVQNLLENYIPTAIATLIEPIWVLMNRLLCLLQPIEELQDCNAKAKDSIDIDYASLPPQLVVWKALRARHLTLGAVCSMALLANLLAVAFAGLFNHQVVDIQTELHLDPPFDLKFVSIDGSIGPKGLEMSGSDFASGAYHGGNGRDQFLALESNYTRNTSLLAWTDKRFFYLPFVSPMHANGTEDSEYEAETTAFGAELDCTIFDPRSKDLFSRTGEPGSIFNSTLTGKDGSRSTCVSDYHVQASPGPTDFIGDTICQQGPSALELVLSLDTANENATQAEKEICWPSIFMGWLRTPNGTCQTSKKTTLNSQNSFFLECRPRLVRGRATIRVDNAGHLLKPAEHTFLEDNFNAATSQGIFETDPINLIAQSNKYLFMSAQTFWHNESYATDFMNHFLQLESNSNRLLDPNQQVPTLTDVEEPLGRVYASLFAAWLGANKDHLLVARTSGNSSSLTGLKITKDERLFLSTPLFAIAEGILCIYAVVACWVYFRRPGKYLARLPTSVASVIPLFAGSTAVQEMRGFSQLKRRGRLESLKQLDYRYGYGSYIGMDGRVHVGIEKAPLIRPWKRIIST